MATYQRVAKGGLDGRAAKPITNRDQDDVIDLPDSEYPSAIAFGGWIENWEEKAVTPSFYICDADNPDNAYYIGKLSIGKASRSWTESGGQYYYDLHSDMTSSAPLCTTGYWINLMGKKLALKWTGGPEVALGYGDSNLTITVTTEIGFTKCEKPKNLKVSSVVSADFTLSWDAGTAGINNNVTGYRVEYSDSSNKGASWGAWTLLTETTSTSVSSSPNATQGEYRKFRVRTKGSAGADYYSDWAESGSAQTNVKPTAPSSLTISPTIWESGAINLTWKASSPGLDGFATISKYLLSYQTSTDNSTWGAWSAEVDLGNVLKTELSPSLSRGTYIKYRIRAVDSFGTMSDYAEFPNSVRRNTVSSAVKNLAASVTLWESGTVVISWGAAEAGTSEVSKYEIQVAVYNKSKNTDGTWTAVTSQTGLSYTATLPSFERGNKLRYRVRAIDTKGAAGDWAYTAYIVRNTIPSVPTGVNASPGIVGPTRKTVVSWNASTDADNNLQKYEIQMSKSTDGGKTWGSWQSDAEVNSPVIEKETTRTGLAEGTRLKFRVRAKDSLGAASDYSAASNVIVIHTADAYPVVVLPVPSVNNTGAKIANATPSTATYATRKGSQSLGFKITYGASVDKLTRVCHFQLRQSNDNGQTLGTVVHTDVKTLGTGSGTVYLRTPVLTPGYYRYDIWLDDGLEPVYIYGYEKTEAWAYTREITAGDVIANESISHQTDINEMVERLNAKRTMYGLSSYSLPANHNGFFAKWKTIMQLLSQKAKECYTALNEQVELPDQNGMYPTAAYLNAVRSMISEV